MSDRLLKESDVIEAFKGRESLIHDVYTATAIIRSVPSADRPSATEIMNAYDEGVRKGIAEAYEAYGADRPQGEWKRRLVDNGFNADWVCSECGYRVKTDFVSFNFCPNCGCRMKGADDE